MKLDPDSRRGRAASFIDRHATVLTLIAMAVLVLVPTKIAYDASSNATDAGTTATGAASRAHHAVVRIENERRQRIFDQNGIDKYFCGRTSSIERALILLLGTSLGIRPSTELNPAQLRAKAVFEEVLEELETAPKCEVLIPPPPKPKAGESKGQGTRSENEASNQPRSTPQFAPPTTPSPESPPPSESGISAPSHEGGHGGSGGAGGHEGSKGGETPSGGSPPTHEGSQSGSPPATEGPTGVATSPPGEPTATAPPTHEEAATGSTSGLNEVTEQVGGAVGGLVEGVCTTIQALAGLCHPPTP